MVTEDGQSLAFGWNKHGQLGSGSARNGRFYFTFAFDIYIYIRADVKDGLTVTLEE